MVVRVIVLAALAVMFFYMFYNMAARNFYSDLPAHIRSAISEEQSSYSLVYPFLAISWNLGKEVGVAAFVTLIEIATIVLSERFLKALMPDTKPEATFVLALLLNFEIGLYMPFIHPHYMQGLSAGNGWHNCTYLAMRLAGIGAIWGYLRFVGYLKSRNQKLDWAIFTVCTIVCAAIKPSFVVIFGPAVVIMCVYDLKKEGKQTVKRSLALGVAFVIVLGVLVYQYTVLFVEDTSSGIGIGFMSVWRRAHFFVPIAWLQSYAFPILVFTFCWGFQKGDRNMRLSLLVFFIALFIYLFIHETGYRKYHGNFGWGLKFGVYYLFITSIVLFCKSRCKLARLITVQNPAAASAMGANAREQAAAETKSLCEGDGEEVAARKLTLADRWRGPTEDDGEGGVIFKEEPSLVGGWRGVVVWAVLLYHVGSGIGNLINIFNGNGYG